MRRYRMQSPNRLPHSVSRSRSPLSSESPLTSYSESSSRLGKRARESSLGSVPTLLSAWDYHKDYGIVHPSGCSICDPYMHHVADASYSTTQPSFDMARQDRHHHTHDIPYHDGITEGRRRQRVDDEDLMEDLEHYRTERNAARAEADRLRSLLKEANNENTRIVADLDSERKPRMHDEEVEVERILVSSPSPARQEVSAQNSTATATELVANEQSTSRMEPVNRFHIPRISGRDFTSPTAQNIPLATSSVSQSQIEHITQLRLPAPDSHSASSPTKAAEWSVIVHAGRDNRPPRTLRQLQSLMRSANEPGNYTALKKVKALCAEAHQTPREQKSELQRVLLSVWRNPGWDTTESRMNITPIPAQSLARNNPRLEDPIEHWVAHLTAYPASWPRGVRRNTNGKPNLSDLKASRMIARLRPELGRDADALTRRTRFMTLAVELFATPGAYVAFLESNLLTVASEVTYTPYYTPTLEDVTPQSVACHFADCGVTVAMAGNELHRWAREYLSASFLSQTDNFALSQPSKAGAGDIPSSRALDADTNTTEGDSERRRYLSFGSF